MYPQVIEKWKTNAQLSGGQDDERFAQAMEEGFRSGAGRAL
jgi:hypothetical protein